MEGVEEANRAAVGSCTKLVASLARSGGGPFRVRPAAETDEAVAMFGKVVTILSNRVGHARAKVGGARKLELDPSFLLEYHPPPANGFRGHGQGSEFTPALPPQPPLPVMTSKHEIKAAEVDYRALFLETPLLDLSGRTATAAATATASLSMAAPVQKQINTSKSPAANPPPPTLLLPPPCATKIQFHQQQQQGQQGKMRVQLEQQQQQKAAAPGEKQQLFQMEMAPRSSKEPEVISFSFDNNSACTSSAASFFTSISSQLISMTSDAAPAPRTKAAPPGCGKKAADADGGCHCPKKKKPREKRVVRMPAISDKVADIPADNYSWRKYGQKPIKGSPHPRGYYRCSSIKDCPARKHVERCRGDAGMLIVTYENDHNHAQPLDLSTLPSNSEA